MSPELPKPGPWMERQYPDLMLLVRVRRANDAAVEYEVCNLVQDEDADEELKFVGDEQIVHGMIKFDGCSHNNFGNELGYYHGCQREHLTRLGPLFDRLYDWAIELIGHEEFLRPNPLV